MKRNVIAQRIREVRERCGLSQQELANLMGWKSHASIVAIESGSQDIKTWELFKLANIMKVTPESLCSEEIEEKLELPVILWRNRTIDSSLVRQEECDITAEYE